MTYRNKDKTNNKYIKKYIMKERKNYIHIERKNERNNEIQKQKRELRKETGTKPNK